MSFSHIATSSPLHTPAHVPVASAVHFAYTAHARTHARTHTHTRTRARAHTHTHTQRERERERETDTHTHTHAHTTACARAHTHTHTHTRSRKQIPGNAFFFGSNDDIGLLHNLLLSRCVGLRTQGRTKGVRAGEGRLARDSVGSEISSAGGR